MPSSKTRSDAMFVRIQYRDRAIGLLAAYAVVLSAILFSGVFDRKMTPEPATIEAAKAAESAKASGSRVVGIPEVRGGLLRGQIC
jgi:hypothetical protein